MRELHWHLDDEGDKCKTDPCRESCFYPFWIGAFIAVFEEILPNAIDSAWDNESSTDDTKYRMGDNADPQCNEEGRKERAENGVTPPAKNVSPEDFRRATTDAIANGNFQGQPVDNFFFQSASGVHGIFSLK